MNTQNTIQIRIDSKTKEAARKTLDELGIDMSLLGLFYNLILYLYPSLLFFQASFTTLKSKRDKALHLALFHPNFLA